jgi:glycosyltransferase involved in cell wall biosynthesis
MAGSALDVRGGVSAVAQVCREQGLFERRGVVYLETHCDGSRWDKARQALRAWLSFIKLLLQGRVALLHAHLNSDASFWRKALIAVPAIAFGVPVVLQVHCGAFAEFYRARCSPPARGFVRWLLRRAAAVIALSEESRAALAEIAPGVAIRVIPNPVAIPPWRARLDSEPPTVLFLGMLTAPKGVFDLLAAWPAVRAAVPRARLVLAGAGAIEEARAIARENGFDASLETPGWIVGEAKVALLREAAVFALPSHWEAMPMSVLEAMAAGLPVVATRVGGVPAAVQPGTGLLVDPGDRDALAASLIRVLVDASLRQAMGTAARLRAEEEFSAAVVVPRIESLWAGILAPPVPDGLRTAG